VGARLGCEARRMKAGRSRAEVWRVGRAWIESGLAEVENEGDGPMGGAQLAAT
jgi:hypothetical protein